MKPSRSKCFSPLFAVYLLTLIFCTGGCADTEIPGIREAAVAGSFYPDDPGDLQRAVHAFLDAAPETSVLNPAVIIVPHAGYIYSGQIAADAFRQVMGNDYSTIVVLGTNHTAAGFRDASIWFDGSYRTPLGTIEVNGEMARRLMEEDERFTFRKDVHEKEHSIEVEIPFVQTLFPNARILPVVVGTNALDFCRDLGFALARVSEGEKTLIVASSDLSHYPVYDDAVRVDHNTIRAICTLEPLEVKEAISTEMSRGVPNLSTCACGEGPILTAMFAASRMGVKRGVVVSYANSGDAPVGDRKRVVGYAAVVLDRGEGGPDLSVLEIPAIPSPDFSLDEEQRAWLLAFARKSIEQYLYTRTAPLARPDDPALMAMRGVFVTLNKNHELRGCIGHMAEDKPLAQVVGSMALHAAFNDRRFDPLQTSEWKDVAIEISVLTPFTEVIDPKNIVIGRDGVVLKKDGRSAVYLPQVAPEQGWNVEETLTHLCEKAGLDRECCSGDARLYTFQADVFEE